MIDFDFPTDERTFIKVIGVGGGGSNAVNHMFEKGIRNVSFVVCNTDYQDLQRSPVYTKLQLGPKTTNGLGCGAKPEVGRQAAEESKEDIEALFDEETKMVFVTAGMGGGTGTGAAPVIARIAHDMGKLTVGIVTIPFKFEMSRKIEKAISGTMEISKNVDALLIINNQRLCDIYQDLPMSKAFMYADDILSESAQSIAEIITERGYINVDFADVCSVLKDSGVAIMNTGTSTPEQNNDTTDAHRISHAIQDALNSPLLNHNNIIGAKRILLNICTTTDHEVSMSEVADIENFIKSINKEPDEVIWGARYDDSLTGGEIKVTIIATGFSDETIHGISGEGELEAEEDMKGVIKDLYRQPEEVPDYEKKIEETRKITEQEAAEVAETGEYVNFDNLSDIDGLEMPSYMRKK